MIKLWRIALISSGLCVTLLTTGWSQPAPVPAKPDGGSRQRLPLVNRILRRVAMRSAAITDATQRASITDLNEWKRQHPGYTLHFAIDGQRSLGTGKAQARRTTDPLTIMITGQEGAVSTRRMVGAVGRVAARKTPSASAPKQPRQPAPEQKRTAGGRAAPVPAPASPGLRIASLAMSMLGKPYVWGGASPNAGFDCSGLTQYILEQIGIAAPRTTWLQYAFGAGVRRQELQPGDLVFFTTYASGPTHVGIYVGNSQFVSALNPTTGVVLSNLHDPYFATRYLGARCPWIAVATATIPNS
ncbi:MAG: C40 family peptidase [Bacilli bacterium]